jgi:hypothetical protein
MFLAPTFEKVVVETKLKWLDRAVPLEVCALEADLAVDVVAVAQVGQAGQLACNHNTCTQAQSIQYQVHADVKGEKGIGEISNLVWHLHRMTVPGGIYAAAEPLPGFTGSTVDHGAHTDPFLWLGRRTPERPYHPLF